MVMLVFNKIYFHLMLFYCVFNHQTQSELDNMSYKFEGFGCCQELHIQERVLHDVILVLLGDEDSRVRHSAASMLVR